MKNFDNIHDVKQLELLIKKIMKYSHSKSNVTEIKSLLCATIGLISFEFPENERQFTTVLTCLYAKCINGDNMDFKDAFDMMFDDLNIDIYCKKAVRASTDDRLIYISDEYTIFKSIPSAKQYTVILDSITTIKNYMNANGLSYTYDLSILNSLDSRNFLRS